MALSSGAAPLLSRFWPSFGQPCNEPLELPAQHLVDRDGEILKAAASIAENDIVLGDLGTAAELLERPGESAGHRLLLKGTKPAGKTDSHLWISVDDTQMLDRSAGADGFTKTAARSEIEAQIGTFAGIAVRRIPPFADTTDLGIDGLRCGEHEGLALDLETGGRAGFDFGLCRATCQEGEKKDFPHATPLSSSFPPTRE